MSCPDYSFAVRQGAHCCRCPILMDTYSSRHRRIAERGSPATGRALRGALCNGPPPARRLRWGRWKNSLGTFPKNCSPTILCGEGLPCKIPPSPRRWAMGQHPPVAIRFLRTPDAMAVTVVGNYLDHYRQSTYFRMQQTPVGSLQESIVTSA